MGLPRILFLDAYDSFSNNVVSLLTTLLGADVDILHIDSPRFDPKSEHFLHEWRQELQHYDAVVCGPGPGSPTNDADVGLIKHIWELDNEHLVPVLGICLGFQSLAVSCGSDIRRVPGGGLHGMIRDIDFLDKAPCAEGNIFKGVQPFKATLYHSLCADIGQDSASDTEWPTSKWQQSPVSDVVPLAWVEESSAVSSGRILMGMKHATKPFWGLQYHPESVCSEDAGHQIISNWFHEALRWNQEHGRTVTARPRASITGPTTRSLLHQLSLLPVDGDTAFNDLADFATDSKYMSTAIKLPSHVEVPDIVELLQSDARNHIILDSASAHTNRIGLDVRGRYSIIALDVEKSLRLEYHVGDSHVCARLPASSAKDESTKMVPLRQGQSVWHLLSDFMSRRTLKTQDAESPFLGGFMGFITYEFGLECIDVDITASRNHQRPDLCFAWVQKSVVIDHLEGTLRVQYLHSSPQEADEWIQTTAATLQSASLWQDGLRINDTKLNKTAHFTPPITPTGASNAATILTPDPDTYEAKVRTCQEYIAGGDSYELCLTDQTIITRTAPNPAAAETMSSNNNSWAPSSATKTPDSWNLYRTLRARQPAPFGSYIRLGGATLISSSPERFLEYDREGLCSMRPMKGTVRKSAACASLAEAERILHVPKEEAENLMIVDLVRHDLHAVCGPGRVRVPQLNKVEEYASVFQMISVVEGQLPSPSSSSSSSPNPYERSYTGLDVLAVSLPPGSMTGAPKKRSCEILQEIEAHRERSLYSGVVGYMDVTGKGDWSVTIRSLFRWDDETSRGTGDNGETTEVWRIGAGGAVTALSTAEGERDEMFTKLKGPLGVFEERS
ncbi:aminodeoxychorismate synthase [Pestalotiopsis sp. NC0098]|nr:aminodeoxychorismate synthase [Pestalotiopsis sp. NC0098]